MSDYKFLMESRLSPRQFQVVDHLSRIAYSEALNLYLVGGAVRDLTYGRHVIRDLDFALEGPPQKLLRHLKVRRPAERPAGSFWTSTTELPAVDIAELRLDKRLNSVEVRFTNGVWAEISQCRRELYTRPGRPPEVSPATIFDDLKRRDFAMNAMAISLHQNSRGLLLDPTNGAGDIERQEIRALYSRSFIDNPIRIYRLLRLGRRLGFKPDEKTRNWLDSALEGRLWAELSPEQQGSELEATFREENPARVLKMLSDRGLLPGLDRKLLRIPYERFREIYTVAGKLPDAEPFFLQVHALISKLSPQLRTLMAKKILRNPRTVKTVLNLDRDAKKLARLLMSARAATPSQAYKLLATQPEMLLLFLLVYYPQDKLQSRLKNYLFKAPQVLARLPRLELQSLGIKPGPKFEAILAQIFFDQLDGKTKTPQQLGRAMRSLAGIKEEPPKPVSVESHPKKPGKGIKPAVSEKKEIRKSR